MCRAVNEAGTRKGLASGVQIGAEKNGDATERDPASTWVADHRTCE